MFFTSLIISTVTGIGCIAWKPLRGFGVVVLIACGLGWLAEGALMMLISGC